MVNVRNRIAALEDNLPQISEELGRFLDLAWTNRAKISLSGPGSAGKIYGLYAKQPDPSHEPPASAATSVTELLIFLRRLEPLSLHPSAQPFGIQGIDEEYPISTFINFFEEAQTQGTLDDENTQFWLSTLRYSFYHMPRMSNTASNGRIYLNVSATFSVEVMSFVIRNLISLFPDALKAKLSGPGNIRADRIVIWVADLNRIDHILRKLSEYQSTHRALFIDGVPRLCKEISLAGGRPLRGVGIASEPPSHNGRPISYGKSRTTEIFLALDEILGGNHNWWNLRGQAAMAAKEDFITQVISRLLKAGINPSQVHL